MNSPRVPLAPVPVDDAPVRVAVVGLGYWGPNLVRNLHEVETAEPVSVCDSRPAALDGVLRRFPALRATTRFEEILADRSVEAVAIATPVSTHFELAAAALGRASTSSSRSRSRPPRPRASSCRSWPTSSASC